MVWIPEDNPNQQGSIKESYDQQQSQETQDQEDEPELTPTQIAAQEAGFASEQEFIDAGGRAGNPAKGGAKGTTYARGGTKPHRASTESQWGEIDIDPSKFSSGKAMQEEIQGTFDYLGNPVGQPDYRIDQDVQFQHNVATRRRNDQLMQDALERTQELYGKGRGSIREGFGSAQSAMQNAIGQMQMYRPGGMAALASGLYQQKAGFYAQQGTTLAQSMQNQAGAETQIAMERRLSPMNLMGPSNEKAIQEAKDAAKSAGIAQGAASLIGTGVGAVAGSVIPGVGTMAGAALGGMLGGAAGQAVGGAPPAPVPFVPPIERTGGGGGGGTTDAPSDVDMGGGTRGSSPQPGQPTQTSTNPAAYNVGQSGFPGMDMMAQAANAEAQASQAEAVAAQSRDVALLSGDVGAVLRGRNGINNDAGEFVRRSSFILGEGSIPFSNPAPQDMGAVPLAANTRDIGAGWGLTAAGKQALADAAQPFVPHVGGTGGWGRDQLETTMEWRPQPGADAALANMSPEDLMKPMPGPSFTQEEMDAARYGMSPEDYEEFMTPLADKQREGSTPGSSPASKVGGWLMEQVKSKPKTFTRHEKEMAKKWGMTPGGYRQWVEDRKAEREEQMRRDPGGYTTNPFTRR